MPAGTRFGHRAATCPLTHVERHQAGACQIDGEHQVAGDRRLHRADQVARRHPDDLAGAVKREQVVREPFPVAGRPRTPGRLRRRPRRWGSCTASRPTARPPSWRRRPTAGTCTPLARPCRTADHRTWRARCSASGRYPRERDRARPSRGRAVSPSSPVTRVVPTRAPITMPPAAAQTRVSRARHLICPPRSPIATVFVPWSRRVKIRPPSARSGASSPVDRRQNSPPVAGSSATTPVNGDVDGTVDDRGEHPTLVADHKPRIGDGLRPRDAAIRQPVGGHVTGRAALGRR